MYACQMEKSKSGIICILKNIDLTGKAWTPIGTDYDNSYKGTFDGGGHTITGLTLSLIHIYCPKYFIRTVPIFPLISRLRIK